MNTENARYNLFDSISVIGNSVKYMKIILSVLMIMSQTSLAHKKILILIVNMAAVCKLILFFMSVICNSPILSPRVKNEY